ncbi:MAG: OsmC family protein [Candidatus Sericytochromatia bacterium]
MPTRQAHATWEGDLPTGRGRMALGSGAYEGAFSFQTRMGDEPGTNPEELIGAALAGCFSMALSLGLTRAGATVRRIQTDARVHFEQHEGHWTITHIALSTEAEVAGVDQAGFQVIAEDTKLNCPVSRALAATEIRLDARLIAP